ncbi:MAG: hypothetical protein AMXMBFR82_44790 [Candidatus Hydrogenedentota bacterium]
MASCTRIEQCLQAQIDGELGDSERVILEQHVAECARCAQMLRERQWQTALLFEALSADRLAHSIRQKVLDHLPEMEVPGQEIDDLNWRAKHPNKWTNRLAHVAPAAAVAILVFLTIVLRFSYPEQTGYSNLYRAERPAVGVVTQVKGEPTRIALDETRRMRASIAALARSGDCFETADGTQMMLSLTGPTVVKLDENTRVKVSDARRLSVDHGTIWLDVAQDGSLFKVITPAGLVTVFGTVFSVRVAEGRTTVTVESGHVQVESGEHLYQLQANQQVIVSLYEDPKGPLEVKASALHQWADSIQTDAAGLEAFARLSEDKDLSKELQGRIAFVIDTTQDGRPREVDAIRLYWGTEEMPASGVSYDVTITDGFGNILRQEHLDAALFRERQDGYYDVVLEDPIRDVRTLVVRLVPDQMNHGEEINIFDVRARTRAEAAVIQ